MATNMWPRITRKFPIASLYLFLIVGHSGCGIDQNPYVDVDEPGANAGTDQNATTKSIVTLDGSASSDANGDLLSYSWTLESKPPRSSVILSDSNAVQPSFTADRIAVYVWDLVVDDGSLASAKESVTITADNINSAPVANPGPDQNVATGSTVPLDGSASIDADGDPLNYSWHFIAFLPGNNVILLNRGNPSPTFAEDLGGDYVFSLVVDENIVHSMADMVTVSATSAR